MHEEIKVIFMSVFLSVQGSSWSFQREREKFCDNFRISGRSFGPNFGFPYTFYTFSFLPQLKIGRSQSA